MAVSSGHQQCSFSFLCRRFRESLGLFLFLPLTEYISHFSPEGMNTSSLFIDRLISSKFQALGMNTNTILLKKGKVLINSPYSNKKIFHSPCLNSSLSPSPKSGKLSEPFKLSKRSLSLRLHMKMKQPTRINHIFPETKGTQAACFLPFRDHKAVGKPIYLACSRKSEVAQS